MAVFLAPPLCVFPQESTLLLTKQDLPERKSREGRGTPPSAKRSAFLLRNSKEAADVQLRSLGQFLGTVPGHEGLVPGNRTGPHVVGLAVSMDVASGGNQFRDKITYFHKVKELFLVLRRCKDNDFVSNNQIKRNFSVILFLRKD